MEKITYRVEDLGSVVGGGTPSTEKDEYWDGDIPWISPADLTGYTDVYISKGAKNITEEGLKKSSTKLLPAGTVLLSSRAPIGYIAIAKNDICTNQGFKSIVCNENIVNNSYLYYFLKLNTEYLKSFASGATFPELSGNRLKRIKLNIARELDVQKKIADNLLNYDNLIINNENRITILEKMAQNLFNEWFVRFRFPGYELAVFENGVPKTFEYSTVEQLSDVLQRGISPAYDDEGKYCVISQKCIRKNIMDISEARKQSKEYKSMLNLKDGDTVICSTGTGTLGRVGQVYGDYPDTTFDSHVTLVRAKNNIGKHFLFYSLKNLQPWFMNMGIGSTNQQELYKKTIQKAKILVPDTTLMNSFEEYIEQIHRQIIALSKANDNLIKQRDLLLPRLMSGKLEV